MTQLAEFFDNTLLRLCILGIPLILLLLWRKRSQLDYLILLFAGVIVIGEVYTLIGPKYNLHGYSVIIFIEAAILSFLVYLETKKKIVWIIGLVPFVFVATIYLATDYSSINLLNIPIQVEDFEPLNAHQFFDLNSIYFLSGIIVTFIWLFSIVNRKERPENMQKRLLYIFAFLSFFGGTFFVIAFARLGLPDYTVWANLWGTIYHPIYLLFYLTLYFGVAWKESI